MKGLQTLFLNFMERKDAYEGWAHNLWMERKLTFAEFTEGEECRFWVDGAFVYPLDTQDYWEVIEREWAHELSDYINARYERESNQK